MYGACLAHGFALTKPTVVQSLPGIVSQMLVILTQVILMQMVATVQLDHLANSLFLSFNLVHFVTSADCSLGVAAGYSELVAVDQTGHAEIGGGLDPEVTHLGYYIAKGSSHGVHADKGTGTKGAGEQP